MVQFALKTSNMHLCKEVTPCSPRVRPSAYADLGLLLEGQRKLTEQMVILCAEQTYTRTAVNQVLGCLEKKWGSQEHTDADPHVNVSNELSMVQSKSSLRPGGLQSPRHSVNCSESEPPKIFPRFLDGDELEREELGCCCGDDAPPFLPNEEDSPERWFATVKRRTLPDDAFHRPESRTSELERKMTTKLQAAPKHRRPSLSHTSTISMTPDGLCSSLPDLMLHPSSSLRTFWDFLTLIVLAYDMHATPVVLCWDLQLTGFLFYMSWITGIWWTGDLILNFRTGIYRDGALEMSPQIVARTYLKSYFVIDMAMTTADWLAIIVAILSWSADQSDMTSLVAKFPRIVKVTKVIRLMSMLRIARFIEPLERLGNQYFSEALRLVVNMVALLILIFWLNHVLGCSFYWLGTRNDTETGYTWRYSTFVENGPSYKDTEQVFQYLTAFHWATTQMTPGSMPVQPLNSVERIFNIICLILGLAFFSSVISSMTATLTQLKMLRQERERVMLTLEKFLRRKTISREVALSVRKQVTARMTRTKPLQMEDVEGLSMLSVGLRQDLMLDLSRTHLRTQQIFRVVDQSDVSVLRQICTTGVKFKVLMEQDILFMQDKVCDETFFVMSGSVKYVQKPIREELFVGEKQWLSWVALWSHWTHVGTAEAESSSEVLTMHADSVFQSVGRSGDLRNFFEDYSISYHKRLTAASPPEEMPNDLCVPFTDYDEIILAIGEKQQKLIGTLALDRVEAVKWSWQGLSAQVVESLQTEVFSGRCVLVENQEGVAERVVPITVVQLERGDGDVLVVLAKTSVGGKLQPAGGLFPGAKHIPGELPGQALHRILNGQLPFAREARIHRSMRDDMKEESARYHITTKYIRVVFRATLPFSFEQPAFLLHAQPSHRPARGSMAIPGLSSWRQTPLPPITECFAIPDGKGHEGFSVCAWMDPDDVEFFKKPEGKKHIESWVTEFEIVGPSISHASEGSDEVDIGSDRGAPFRQVNSEA